MQFIDLTAGGTVPDAPPFVLDEDVVRTVRGIIDDVRANGDAALIRLTGELDGADISDGVEVSRSEIDSALESIDSDLRDALERMAARMRTMHERQVPKPWSAEGNGVTFGETVKPLASAAGYVPGGRASYPSTVVMTAIPASVAGVSHFVVSTPPSQDGSVSGAVLAAASLAGVSSVYRVGGAQAIAALAFGTESIRPVDKIVGPGTVWVTAAKREVMGSVGIDSLAGPTELVILADSTADAGILAADLVAQAEHDPMARAALVTRDASLARTVQAAAEAEASKSPRRDVVEKALSESLIVVAADEKQAAAAVDEISPEHLQIATASPRETLARVRSYGAAFLGIRTPVAFGDYGVGSNHVLPTMGTARFASGLRAADFVTVSSFVEAAPGAVSDVGLDVEAIAEAEGLPGHARTNSTRREKGM